MRAAFPRVLIPLAVALFVLASPALAHEHSGTFVDDDGVPGEIYIERLADFGAIQGCNPPSNTRSCPLKELTRAEAFKVLVVAGQTKGDLPGFPSSLTDRFDDDDAMWDGAVSRLANFLADRGIIDGCNPPENTRVCPDEELSRAQVAKLVAGTFGLTAPDDYRAPWSDSEGKWYERAASIAAYHKLWDTTSDHFNGAESVNRAEFARVVVRAGGERFCDADPFTAGRVDRLESRHSGQDFTAYAYDTRTGCAYWMNPEHRLRTASVFKVMVMAGTLLEAQEAERRVTSWEWSQLEPMITESANPPVRALWRSFGASPWFNQQVDTFGLEQTNSVGDTQGVWGRTTTSAKDQADLIRQVLLGEWGPLTADYRDDAWSLMSSVVPAQTWGVTAGVPSGWTVAQKNGFAGHITNSVGFVRAPGSEDGYVVAILSNGWPHWTTGVDVIEEIAGWVSSALAR